jgi:hypothetical protein
MDFINVPYPHIKITLNNLSYYIEFDSITRWRGEDQLGLRWVEALKKNLKNKLVLEKNFCFLGFANSKRNLKYLVNEVNEAVTKINTFTFNPPYPKLKHFTNNDFQYPDTLPVGKEVAGDIMATPGLRLKHEGTNFLHRYFEDLQGPAWNISDYYKQADHKTKYAIRQLNILCHEIEGWVNAKRKSVIEPEWMRPSQITTFLHAPRYDLHEDDFELFKLNRYNRELGGVYLHWSQVGKTLFEVFRDKDEAVGEKGISHQRYYSGEFDIEWGQTITDDNSWKNEETNAFKTWLKNNNYDWNDPKLALGYIKLGQVDLKRSFGTENFLEIYDKLSNNLNITKIEVIEGETTECNYPYSLESPNWQQMQINAMKAGYESYSMR